MAFERRPATAGWMVGKRALVVGGGSGIGRAVVDAFLSEGARVAVLDRDPTKCAALTTECPDVQVVVGDATTRSANEEAVGVAVREFGGLDTLVNCVGVFDFFKGIGDLAPDVIDRAFDEMFAVNVKSFVHSVKAVLPALTQQGGSIVLTESISSYTPGRGGVLYTSSKFAVRGLVAALAHELASASIRVNGVAPAGTVRTDMRGLSSLGQSNTKLANLLGSDEERAATTPLGLALGAVDHAWAFVYLASDRARGVTGDVIRCDAGLAIGR